MLPSMYSQALSYLSVQDDLTEFHPLGFMVRSFFCPTLLSTTVRYPSQALHYTTEYEGVQCDLACIQEFLLLFRVR